LDIQKRIKNILFSLILFCLILVKCDFDIFLFVDSVLYGFFFMYLELLSSDVFFLGSNENDSLLIQFFMDNTGEGNNPSRLPGSNAGSRLDINDIRLYDIDDLGNSNLEAEDDRKPAAKKNLNEESSDNDNYDEYDPNDLGNSNLEAEDDRKPAAKKNLNEESSVKNGYDEYDPNDLGNSNFEAEDDRKPAAKKNLNEESSNEDDRKPEAKDLTGRKRPATELNLEENSEISRPSFLLADNIDDLYVIGIE
jgi:hypothetical protein